MNDTRLLPTLSYDRTLEVLDEMLLEDGRMKLLPAATLLDLPRDLLRLWAHRRGRYQLPTLELVAWLRQIIDGRTAIEVAAGAGDLGYRLGIPMSDSYVQQTNLPVAAWSLALGAKPTEPPPDVERLDAVSAVEKYRPQVVVAAWMTQLYAPGDEGPPKIGSSIYGVAESRILDVAETYIHIGNERIHGDKRVRERPHVIYRFPWIVSKASDPAANVIYVWHRAQRSGR